MAILFGSMLQTGQWEVVIVLCYCSKPCGSNGTGDCSSCDVVQSKAAARLTANSCHCGAVRTFAWG
jgi:hypothetical protein